LIKNLKLKIINLVTGKNRQITLITLILLLAGSLRFYNLMHDYPYFFNPDERNMANAITQFKLPSQSKNIVSCLNSEILYPISNFQFLNSNKFSNSKIQTSNCNLNPHFFAYSQFPLYLAFTSDQITKPFIQKISNHPDSIQNSKFPGLAEAEPRAGQILTSDFPSAIFWLRFYSALSSTLTVLFIYLIVNKIANNKLLVIGNWKLEIGNLAALSAAFSPGFIQSAHFGTTEALLTFFFIVSLYYSIKLISDGTKKDQNSMIHARPASRSEAGDSIFIILISIACGLAIGSKLTGLFFLIPPGIAVFINIIRLMFSIFKKPKYRKPLPLQLCSESIGDKKIVAPQKKKAGFHALRLGINIQIITGLSILLLTALITIVASPYNLIEPDSFKNAVFGYEKDVATGKYEAFYTMQFKNTLPVLFQMKSVFPYVLGWPVFILGTIGFLFSLLILIKKSFLLIYLRIMNHESRIKGKRKKSLLTFHDSYFLILASSFLVYFLPNAFLYAKWTRFMTPILPFFYIYSSYFLYQIYQFFHGFEEKIQNHNLKVKSINFTFIILIFAFCILSLLPGAAFMSIYTHEDIRITASRFIYKTIPDNSYLLFETANVIDIPLGLSNSINEAVKKYTMISFDYYHIDDNPVLFENLLTHIDKADYILIPSRRIFYNYPRFPDKYPKLTKYYQALFSGNLGFDKIAEISSFPKISFPLNALPFTLSFPDESAEETYTVFDHPVIRIYKKVQSLPIADYRKMLIN
jgi:hypothetical protein